jgi:post-segregation antitoxin (ccd killing protein)
MAVLEIIKTTKELYPGSNIIAILREKAEDIAIDARSKRTLALESETEKQRIDRWKAEAVPMPESCRIELEKLGLKTP